MKSSDIIEPPDRPSIGLSIRKRNQLNLEIQAQNDEAILAHDPALGTLTLQAYYAYSYEEVENLVANQRYCESVGPFPCCLSTRIETARRMRRAGWYVRIEKGDVGSNVCPIEIDADEEEEEDVKPKIETHQSLLDSQITCKEAFQKVEVACSSFAADVVNIDSLGGPDLEDEEKRIKLEEPLPELERNARIDVKNERNERDNQSRNSSTGDADDSLGPEPIQGQSAIDEDDDDDIDPNLIHIPIATHEHQVSIIRPLPSLGDASRSSLPNSNSNSKRRRSSSPTPPNTRSLRARTQRKS